jgi:hypothetical protein
MSFRFLFSLDDLVVSAITTHGENKMEWTLRPSEAVQVNVGAMFIDQHTLQKFARFVRDCKKQDGPPAKVKLDEFTTIEYFQISTLYLCKDIPGTPHSHIFKTFVDTFEDHLQWMTVILTMLETATTHLQSSNM